MKNFTRWDDYLIAEHELIERAMEVLKNCLEPIELDEEVHKVQLGRAIDFLLQFGDKIHNRKEEEVLFPLMGEKGIPVEGGPLGVMLLEHEAERKLLEKMLFTLPGLGEMTLEERIHFKEEGMEYLTIRADHIWKENDVLYPMGRKVLSEDDNTDLLAKFDVINSETYGDEAFGKFQTMVKEVEKGERDQKK